MCLPFSGCLGKDSCAMANKIRRTKSGMGGSRNGRGRTEKTAIMKEHSRTERRRQQERLAAEQLAVLESVQAGMRLAR